MLKKPNTATTSLTLYSADSTFVRHGSCATGVFSTAASAPTPHTIVSINELLLLLLLLLFVPNERLVHVVRIVDGRRRCLVAPALSGPLVDVDQ